MLSKTVGLKINAFYTGQQLAVGTRTEKKFGESGFPSIAKDWELFLRIIPRFPDYTYRTAGNACYKLQDEETRFANLPGPGHSFLIVLSLDNFDGRRTPSAKPGTIQRASEVFICIFLFLCLHIDKLIRIKMVAYFYYYRSCIVKYFLEYLVVFMWYVLIFSFSRYKLFYKIQEKKAKMILLN